MNLTKTNFVKLKKFHGTEFFFKSIDSTQKFARELIKENLDEYFEDNKFITVRATKQEVGVGQYERVWNSPEGNLYLTSIIPVPNDKEAQDLINLSQMISLLIHQILKDYRIDTEIKWINDVMYCGKKISGNLSELYDYNGSNSGKISKVAIIGIGLNINLSPLGRSTCMKEAFMLNNFINNNGMVSLNCVQNISVEDFSDHIACRLGKFFRDFLQTGIKPHLDYINSNLAYAGQNVILNSREETFKGALKGINDNGMAVLTIDEKEKEFSSGSMFLDLNDTDH